MAMSRLQFSCVLDVGTPENASRSMQIYRSSPLKYSDAFDLTIDDDHPSQLFIDDGDGCGIPAGVEHFVKRCAREFNLTGKWGFQYALTYANPRFDHFGGGGAIVIDLSTGNVIDSLSTKKWLAAALADQDLDE